MDMEMKKTIFQTKISIVISTISAVESVLLPVFFPPNWPAAIILIGVILLNVFIAFVPLARNENLR